MSCLKCHVISSNWRDVEVTIEGRVWPCCHIATTFDELEKVDPKTFFPTHPSKSMDKIILDRMKNDPDWNRLDAHNMEDILKDKLFQKFPTEENPQGDQLDICMRWCEVK